MRDKGKGVKTIAKSLRISKNTVKEYLRKVEAGNVPVKELLRLEDPILEKTLLSGNPAYKKDARCGQLKDRLSYYAKELGYSGSFCASDFGGWVPGKTVQTVPFFTVRFVPLFERSSKLVFFTLKDEL